MKDCVILGMLTQMKEGEWWLEDPTGAIKLNIQEASFHKGIFVESSLVLAEGDNSLYCSIMYNEYLLGTFDDGILNVSALGFPPTETSKKTREYFGNINFFGGKRTTNVGSSERLSHLEMRSENSICILSDVKLDNPRCFNRLERLIQGFSISPPMAFIIAGDFLEDPYHTNAFELLKQVNLQSWPISV